MCWSPLANAILIDSSVHTFIKLQGLHASGPECVFWDSSAQGWNSTGCTTEESLPGTTRCKDIDNEKHWGEKAWAGNFPSSFIHSKTTLCPGSFYLQVLLQPSHQLCSTDGHQRGVNLLHLPNLGSFPADSALLYALMCRSCSFSGSLLSRARPPERQNHNPSPPLPHPSPCTPPPPWRARCHSATPPLLWSGTCTPLSSSFILLLDAGRRMPYLPPSY